MDAALTALPSSAPSLYDDEEIQSRSFEGIGLYSGNTKLPAPLDLLTGQITSHRILLFPPVPLPSSPAAHGVSIALADVRSTEFYAGFLKSSAKVTLMISTIPPSVNVSATAAAPGWTCGVCGYANAAAPPGAADRLVNCTMCGISRDRSLLANSIAIRTPPGNIPHSRPLSAAGGLPSQPSASSASASPAPLGDDAQVACPTCTFLNSPLLHSCEICTTPLPKQPRAGGAAIIHSPKPTVAQASKPPVTVDSVIRLSFRRGGEKEFYAILKRALSSKAWNGGLSRAASAMASARPTTTTPTPASGIDRILSTMSVQDSTRSDRIETSLRDLESLMAQASEMVKLASALSSRQPISGEAASSSSNGPAATLSAPAFTQDMLASTAASEEAYLRELAKELAGLLTGRDGLMVDRLVRIKGKGNMRRKGRGMLGLDEVWCLWNRARGVALIPPKTFRSTLTYLPALTDPSISLRTFRSSAHCVLHTPFFSAPSFRRRLLSALAPTEPAPLPSISTVELALAEDVGVGLAKEMVEELEADAGEVVRDAQGGAGGGERWYRNLISSCTWVELNDLT